VSPENDLATHNERKTNKKLKIKHAHTELSRVEQES